MYADDQGQAGAAGDFYALPAEVGAEPVYAETAPGYPPPTHTHTHTAYTRALCLNFTPGTAGLSDAGCYVLP